MKRICNNIIFRLSLVFLSGFMSTLLWAQDSTGSSNKVITSETTTTTTTWYAQPWVWIVGGAVFIIILVALLRGNSSKDKTEVSRSTTIIKDRDR